MWNHYESPKDRLDGLGELNDYLSFALAEAQNLRLCNIAEMLRDLQGDLQMDLEEAKEAVSKDKRECELEEKNTYNSAVG